MSFFNAVPDAVQLAAADLAGIGSTIKGANATAAVSTTAIPAAASDQVSAAVAALYSGYARGYQALGTQVAAFHEQFVRALGASASTYALAEAANAAAVQNPLQHLAQLVNAPIEAAAGHPAVASDGGAGGEHREWIGVNGVVGGSGAPADSAAAGGLPGSGGSVLGNATGSDGSGYVGAVGMSALPSDAGHSGGALFGVRASGGGLRAHADATDGPGDGGLLGDLILRHGADSQADGTPETKDRGNRGGRRAAPSGSPFRITRSWPDRWLSNTLRRNGTGTTVVGQTRQAPEAAQALSAAGT
ncbi:PE family protein [Mycobacterium asiaticum]|uniref:PE domain-containing protein n=1 Tax=Mycobacterium asiaticum TaxID=1790 RepID=A0A1A3MQJ6_MYCAS|nr:PE family protein [Mycobacterium asiaticum]OBK11049.1 hypothetical protein A5636_14095 [Mycobacterium asiaticum]